MAETTREWLRARRLPTADTPLPADPVAYAAAERYLEACARTLELAQVRQVDDLQPYRDAVSAAQAALIAQPVKVFVLRCLAPEMWDELVTANPPTAEQRTLGWQWNVAEFRPAVLAACVVPPEGEESLGVRGWVEVAEEGQLAPGELDLLFINAVNLNARQPQVSVGKG